MKLTKQNVCPACNSTNIREIEAIATVDLAKFWSKSQAEAGETILNYLQSREIPDTVHIAKCSNCGLEFGNPRFAVDNEWYQQFERYGKRWEYWQCLRDLDGSRCNVLEIGCGEGHFLEMASEQEHNTIGLDFNQTAIKVARGKGLTVNSWNLKEVKDEVNQQFNVVVFFHVIEHLDDPVTFFADLAEIMPLGSSLHFSCPGPNRFTTHLEPDKKVGLRDVWDYPPFHQTRWNQDAAVKLLSRFGWQLVKYVEEPFHWMGISSMLANKEWKISEQPSFQRKISILTKMCQTFIPSLKYKGMSMYCMAVRKG